MKLVVRIFALSLVVAGAAAAGLSSSAPATLASHQSAAAGLPIPTCGPGIPGCPQTGK